MLRWNMLVNWFQRSKVGTLICKPARTSRRWRQSNELKNPENTVVCKHSLLTASSHWVIGFSSTASSRCSFPGFSFCSPFVGGACHYLPHHHNNRGRRQGHWEVRTNRDEARAAVSRFWVSRTSTTASGYMRQQSEFGSYEDSNQKQHLQRGCWNGIFWVLNETMCFE
jgi:hypothetical protein